MKRSLALFSTLFVICAAVAAVNGKVPQPQNLNLTAASDTGRLSNDNLTRDRTPEFTVGNITAGATVELLRDGVAVAGITAGKTGVVTLTDPGLPRDGAYSYRVRQTLGGNIRESAVSEPLSIVLDIIPPTLTIDQAATQADPTTVLSINYTVVLSERPMFGPWELGFGVEDISSQGSTGRYIYAGNLICDTAGTTCTVGAVSSTPGTLRLSVPGGVFEDMAGNPNLPSSSTDNTVTFNPPVTTMNFLGRVTWLSGRVFRTPLTVKIFDNVTDEVFTVHPNSAGYFRLNDHPYFEGTWRSMSVRVYDKNGQQIYFDAFGVNGDRFLHFKVNEPE